MGIGVRWINLSGYWSSHRSSYSCHHIGCGHVFARAVGTALDLDLAFGKALRPDHNLPGNAEQIGSSEFGARALVGVVIEHVDAFRGELVIELFASRIRMVGALLQVEDDG